MNMDGTTIIHKPVDEVFAYVSDLSNDIYWLNGVDESGLRSGNPIDSHFISSIDE